MTKTCFRCARVKSLDKFYLSNGRHRNQCIPCWLAVQKEHRSKPERKAKIKAYRVAYQSTAEYKERHARREREARAAGRRER